MKRKLTLKLLSVAVFSFAAMTAFGQAPVNDDCAGAINMVCGDTLSGSTTTATNDVAPICSAGLELTGPAVWYSFTGTGDAIEVSLCHAATTYDTKVVVYSGSCGSLVCVGGNDDAGGACGLQSIAYFTSNVGTTYYFAVTGYATGTGDFDISVACSAPCTPVPANDDCVTAQSITVAADTNSCTPTNGTNTCAAISLANPSCSQFSNCQDVWYTFNSGSNSSVIIDFEEITGSSFTYALYDTCGNPNTACGVLVDGINIAGVNANTDYWLQIFTDGNTTAGDFALCVSNGPPAPANDDCAVTPTTLVNGAPPTTFTGTTYGGTASAEELAVFNAGAVWEAVTLTDTCNDLTIDYCGTGAGIMVNAFIVVTDCPLTAFTAGTWENTTCVDSNLTIQIPGLAAGTYYIPVFTDAPNIQGPYTMNVSSVTCGMGGIGDLDQVEQMIYPNPASDVINFKGDDLSGEVSIVNELGAVVLTTELKESVNIAKLPNGVYIVSITKDDSVHNEKLIIKR